MGTSRFENSSEYQSGYHDHHKRRMFFDSKVLMMMMMMTMISGNVRVHVRSRSLHSETSSHDRRIRSAFGKDIPCGFENGSHVESRQTRHTGKIHRRENNFPHKSVRIFSHRGTTSTEFIIFLFCFLFCLFSMMFCHCYY